MFIIIQGIFTKTRKPIMMMQFASDKAELGQVLPFEPPARLMEESRLCIGGGINWIECNVEVLAHILAADPASGGSHLGMPLTEHRIGGLERRCTHAPPSGHPQEGAVHLIAHPYPPPPVSPHTHTHTHEAVWE